MQLMLKQTDCELFVRVSTSCLETHKAGAGSLWITDPLSVESAATSSLLLQRQKKTSCLASTSVSLVTIDYSSKAVSTQGVS